MKYKEKKIFKYIWVFVLLGLLCGTETRAGTAAALANSVLNTCDCTGTGDLFVDVLGNTATTGYMTVAYLVDGSGAIVSGPTATAANFPGTAAGSYTVYVVNYDSTDPATATAVGAVATGADIEALPGSGVCADFDSVAASVDGAACGCNCTSILNVCPCEGDANLLDVNVAGNTTTTGYDTWYIAVGAGAGGCNANMTGDFSGLPDDTYDIYVVNYDTGDANAATILTAIQNCDVTTLQASTDCVDIEGPVAGSVNGPTCTCCAITDATVTNIICNDPNTPSDPSDDTFTFDVVVTDTGGDITGWTATDANTTTGAYGATVTFGPYLISGGQLSFDINDNSGTAGCTIPVVVDPPAACSCVSILNVCPCEGDVNLLDVNVLGNTTDVGYDTWYIAVGGTSSCTANMTGDFSGLADDTYDIYVVNYDTGDANAATILTAIQACDIAGINTAIAASDCVDMDGPVAGSVNGPTCTCCPTAMTATGSDVVCTDGTTELGVWQAAVVTANTGITGATGPLYSSVPIGDASFPTAVGDAAYTGDNCATEMEPYYAYYTCDSDGSFLDAGSYTLTLYPDIANQTNVLNNDNGCGPSIVLQCATGYTVTNDYDANGATPVFTSEFGTGTLNFTITLDPAVAALAGTGCEDLVVPASYNCTVVCPTVAPQDAMPTICDGGLGTELGDWQTAVTGANPATDVDGTSTGIVYSSTDLGATTTTAPDGDVSGITGVHSGADNCTPETQTVYAYLGCSTNGDAIADSYELAGTFTLTVYPDIANQTNVLNNDGACGPSITLECATGYTVTNDYDANGATPVFTSEFGTGTLNFTITLDPAVAALAGTGCEDLVVPASYNCTVVCPTVAPQDAMPTICDGGLGTELGDWQTAVTGANPATDVDGTSTGIVYSSTDLGATTTTAPDGDVSGITGVHSGADNCTPETQTVYAYLGCSTNGDAIADSYELAGTFTLTVYPDIANQTNVLNNDGACGPSITLECATGYTVTNDYDANGATPVFTSEFGTGTLNFTITLDPAVAALAGTGCEDLVVPASYNCTVVCPTVAPQDAMPTICDGGLGTELGDWQTAVTGANPATDVDGTSTGIVYSSTDLGATTTTAPDGDVSGITGVHSGADNCTPETQTVYAYLGCSTNGDAIADSYELAGTFTLTVYPDIANQVNVVNNPNTCGPSITLECAAGYIVTNDYDGNGANPDFSAEFGAGLINFTVALNPAVADLAGTGCEELVIPSSYSCTVACPTIAVTNDSPIVCDGDLGTTLSDWQTAVTAANPATDPDATSTGVEYSSAPLSGGVPTPDGNLSGVTGVHSGANNCSPETQIAYAYLGCSTDGDAIADSYQLVGTFTLTVYPDIANQANVLNNNGGCCPTLTLECPGGYTATHNYNGGGTGNPDCSAENGSGNFTFTVSLNNAPAGLGAACISNTYAATYDCTVPSIVIDKDDADNTDDTQTVPMGGTATFTISVTNNGTEDLCNVVVTDPNGASCEMTYAGNGGTLIVGDTWTYTCTVTNVTADFVNTAFVTAEGCDSGIDVDSEDPTTVVVVDPEIDIVKEDETPTPGDPADQDGVDDQQTLVVGGTATFTITVTNTGTEDLCSVEVTDPNGASCEMTYTANGGVLAVGASWTYTCTVPNVTGGFVNTALVTAEGCTTGTDVDDNDPTTVVIVGPDVTVEKNDADNGDDTQTVPVGGTATFTITVVNTGTEDLCDVEVTDPNGASCEMNYTATGGILAVGDSWTYTCTVNNVTADFINTAFVVAEGCITGTDVDDDDDSEVLVEVCPAFVGAPDPSLPCPSEDAIVTVNSYYDDPDFATSVIVTNNVGIILGVFPVDANGEASIPYSFWPDQDENYFIYSFNYDTNDPPDPMPMVGNNIVLIGTTDDGCFARSTTGSLLYVPSPLVVECEYQTYEGDQGGITPFYYNTHEICIGGGTLPYNYIWETTGYVRHAIVGNGEVRIIYGDHAIWYLTVTDANGCTLDPEWYFTNDPTATDGGGEILDVYYDLIVPASACDQDNGSIELYVEGGTMPYTFEWSGPNTVNGVTVTGTGNQGDPYMLENLTQGWYVVTITDSGNPPDASGVFPGSGATNPSPAAGDQQTTTMWYWVHCNFPYTAPDGSQLIGRGKVTDITRDADIGAYPNPFEQETTIEFGVNETENINIVLYAVDGKRVGQLFNGQARAGEVYTLPFKAGRLPSGVYIVRLTTESGKMKHAKLFVSP